MKIGLKIYISFWAIIIAVGLFSLLNVIQFNSVTDYTNSLTENEIPNLEYISEMRVAVFKVQLWLTDVSATNSKDGLKEAEIWAEIYRTNSKNLKNNLNRADKKSEVKQIDNIDKSFEKFYEFGQVMASTYIDQGQYEGNKLMEDFNKYSLDITNIVEDFKEQKSSELDDSFITMDEKQYTFNLSVISAMIAGILFTIFISISLKKIIVIPITKVTAMLKDIAQGEGDLTKTLDSKSKDEIGELSHWFNQFTLSQKQMIGNIKKIADEALKSGEAVSFSFQEVNSTSNEVANTIQEIALGSQNLSKFSQETKNNADTLIKSIKEVANNAQTSANNANRANEAAQQGSQTAKEAGEKMKSISQSVNGTAKVIQELGEKSVQINKIIEVINSISGQTNLLALNAAIEAARAGEAGKGFAVVADEVRKLAEDSQKATKQIEQMILEIVANTKLAVDSMGKGTIEVEEGSKIINESLESLQEIGNSVSVVATNIEEISAATQEQMASSENVQKAISEVSLISEKSAASTEKVSASMEETTSAMAFVANSAKNMVKTASDLNDIVNKFKI